MMYLILILLAAFNLFAAAPRGYNGIFWASDIETVSARYELWEEVDRDLYFPSVEDIRIFKTEKEVANYPSEVLFYFFDDALFQVTVNFDFSHLSQFSHNYNVFISVDQYYRHIRENTLVFVYDIYGLLRRLYGKKQPVFRGIDPRNIFTQTDAYIAQERWNFRYNPSEYYKRIVATAFAQWRFPETEILFTLALSAADARFDYVLSYSSPRMVGDIKRAIDISRSEGL